MAVPLSTGTLYIVEVILTILITWIVVSIPIYFAGKIISKKHTTFGKAMLAAIAAPIVTLFFFFIVTVALTLFLGPLAVVVGLIIAILVLSYVYASIFDTGLLGGFGIAILATVISYVIALIVVAALALLFGVTTLPLLPGKGSPFP